MQHRVSCTQEYTFTLTYGDGRRFHGFCRKFLPPAPRIGSKLRFPQVLCLISEYPWCNMYFKVGGTSSSSPALHVTQSYSPQTLPRNKQVLQVLEQLLKSSDQLLESGGKDLSASSHTGTFLKNLGDQLKSEPLPGQILK